MSEKAIEAAARARYEAIGIGPWYDLCQEDKDALLGNMRHTIAAYEAAMWVPFDQCPEEWKDGRPLLAERAFDGNYKTDLPTYFEIRWRTDGFNFTGFMDFQGRRINATRVRPLPPVLEGK